MSESANPATWVVLGGFVLAFIFGAVANKTNFCTMGAISDVVNMAHWGRMRMWLLTIAVAMLGTSLLSYFEQIDISKSVYQRPTLAWAAPTRTSFAWAAAACARWWCWCFWRSRPT